MKSFLVQTESGPATVTFNDRSLSMKYEDGALAFILHGIIPLAPKQKDYDMAFELVFKVFMAYGVNRPAMSANEIIGQL